MAAAGAPGSDRAGCARGWTAWVRRSAEGHGVREVGFIAAQMRKPSVPSGTQTALRPQEGVDAVPSGECPPHHGDRAPCVWDFLHDDFSRWPQAGALICLKAKRPSSLSWPQPGFWAGSGRPGLGRRRGRKSRPLGRRGPTSRHGGSLKLFGWPHQGRSHLL